MYIGIDPGWEGIISSFDNNEKILSVDKIPSFKTKRNVQFASYNKREIDSHNLMKIADRLFHEGHYNVTKMFIENVRPRPRDGRKAVCTMCKNFGIVVAVFDLVCLEAIPIEPKLWKEYFNLSRDKEESIKLAVKIFGKRDCKKFGVLNDHNVAEALLIGLFGKRMIEEGKL